MARYIVKVKRHAGSLDENPLKFLRRSDKFLDYARVLSYDLHSDYTYLNLMNCPIILNRDY